MLTVTESLQLAGVVALTLTAIVYDLRSWRIPNWLTVSGLVLGLLFHGLTGGWRGLAFSLGGFATGFGLLLVLWLIGGGGAGDVKLMGALGSWIGSTLTVYVLILSAVFVAVGGTAVLLGSMLVRGPSGFRRAHLAAGPADPEPAARARRRLMPYALPLGLGAWVVTTWKLVAPHLLAR